MINISSLLSICDEKAKFHRSICYYQAPLQAAERILKGSFYYASSRLITMPERATSNALSTVAFIFGITLRVLISTSCLKSSYTR